MYEELITNLRNCAETNSLSHYKWTLMQCAADAIEELQAINERQMLEIAAWDKPKWISVKDRLPEEGELVLTCSYGTDVIIQKDGETLEEAIARVVKIPNVSAGAIDGEGFWDGIDGYPMIIQPSFWMPFPEPPKTEEGE